MADAAHVLQDELLGTPDTFRHGSTFLRVRRCLSKIIWTHSVAELLRSENIIVIVPRVFHAREAAFQTLEPPRRRKTLLFPPSPR